VMPAFGEQLDPTARWNLFDFFHANADATRFGSAADAGAAAAFRTPDFAVDCPDGSSPLISEQLGRVLHLVFAGADSAVRVHKLEPMAIVVHLDPSASTDGSFCGTDNADVAKAFALYAGTSVEELDGTEFIVDQSGALRSWWHPGLVPDWTEGIRPGDRNYSADPLHAAPGSGTRPRALTLCPAHPRLETMVSASFFMLPLGSHH
jgi:hypothetical protein